MTDSDTPLYCEAHHRPTSLRCNNCDKPICPKCSVATPTGYRCKDCIRGQQKKFENAIWYDYLLAFLVGAGISYISGRIVNLLVSFLGYFIILIFVTIGATAGLGIAEAIRFITRRRRSRRLFQLASAAVVVGFLPVAGWALISGNYWSALWVALCAVSTASAVYARLRGLHL